MSARTSYKNVPNFLGVLEVQICNYGWTMKVQLRFWNVSFLTLTDEIGFFIGDKKTENTKSSGTGIGFSKSENCLAFKTKVLCQDKL